MEIITYLSILRRHIRILVLVPAIAALVALGATYIVSPSYKSVAKVQVIAGQVEPDTMKLQSENGLSDFPLGFQDVTGVLTKQTAEALKRRSVAEEVVRRLKLDEAEPISGPIEWLRNEISRAKTIAWDVLRYGEYLEKPPFEQAVDRVQAAIDAEPVQGSFVVEVSGRAKRPELATAIANMAVEVFQAENGELAAEPAREKRLFLESQLDSAEERLRNAQIDLADYQADKGILSSPDQARLQVESLEKIRGQIRDTNAEISDTQAQLDLLTKQLREVPQEVTSTEETSQTNSQKIDGSTSSEQGNSKVDHNGSSDSFEEQRSPMVTKATIQSKTNVDGSSSSKRTSPNPVYQDLETSLMSTKRSLAGLEAKRTDLESTLAKQESANREWVQGDSRMDELVTRANLAKEQYSSISNDLFNARLDEMRPSTPVRILEMASPPLYPVSPIRGYVVGGAIIFGLLVSIVLVFVLDYCDLSIKNARQAEDALGLPLLGEVVMSPQKTKSFRQN